MGCDIHVRLEVKNRDDIWESCEMYQKDRYRVEGEPEFRVVDVYNDRDDELFTALCGVRNTGGGPYISKPIGTPHNASKESIDYLVDYWSSDGHSHSWNTLKELYDYQENNKTVKRAGLISPEASELLDSGAETPSTWCQGSNNKTLVQRAWEEERDTMGALISAIESQVRKILYIWNPEENAEDIRILYCFDN
jgi:hypothetical protein